MSENLPAADHALMESMLPMSPMEQLGQILYERKPSRILQPIQSEDDRRTAVELLRQYGIDCSTELAHEQLTGAPFTPVLNEQSIIRSRFDIMVTLHPRFLGNAPHVHDYFELNYVCQGSTKHQIAQRQLDLYAGDLIVMAPGIPHDVLSLDVSNVVLTVCIRKSTFSQVFFELFSAGDVFYEYFQNILYRNQAAPYLLFRTGKDMEILHLFLNMYREAASPRTYSSRYLNLLMSEIFLRLLRDHCGHLSTGTSDTEEHAPVALMLQYISVNCRDVTLQAVAEKFHYNTSYLSRLLKESMGKTFVTLRAELRLDQARKLLETSSASTAQIAEMVGYQNISHFYKAFRERTGFSPRDYRKQALQDPLQTTAVMQESPS